MNSDELRALADALYGLYVGDSWKLVRQAADYLRQCAEEVPTAWMFKRRYGSGLQFREPPLTVNEEDEVEYPVPLYIHPAPAQPVPEPLTDGEIDAIPFDCDPDVMDSILSESLRKFSRAILKAQEKKA
jgi:hypothetical protein